MCQEDYHGIGLKRALGPALGDLACSSQKCSLCSVDDGKPVLVSEQRNLARPKFYFGLYDLGREQSGNRIRQEDQVGTCDLGLQE